MPHRLPYNFFLKLESRWVTRMEPSNKGARPVGEFGIRGFGIISLSSKLVAQHGEHVGVEYDAGGVTSQDQRAEPEVAFGTGIGARYQLDSGPPQEPGLDEHGKAYGASELDHVFSLGPRGPIEELLGPESVRHEVAPNARGSPSWQFACSQRIRAGIGLAETALAP